MSKTQPTIITIDMINDFVKEHPATALLREAKPIIIVDQHTPYQPWPKHCIAST